jgi:hypothetical protein
MFRRVSAAAATAAVVVASTVALLGVSTAPAWADCPPDPINVSTGLCLSDTVPGTPPTTDPGPTPGPGPSGPACPGAPNGECVNDYGFVWIGPPHNCYGFPLDPQPKAGDRLWKGHDPSEGSVWSCDPTISVPENTWFVPNGETVIDPGAVAQQLVKRAPFELATAHIAPSPDYHTYINYLNWLWIPEGQWHDVSVSLTVAGATVTLTAKPTYVSWDMGNGESTSCAGPGRAWVKGMPEDAPTNCSFQYSTMQDPRVTPGPCRPASTTRSAGPAPATAAARPAATSAT